MEHGKTNLWCILKVMLTTLTLCFFDLQVKNILYHAVKDAIAVLRDTAPKYEGWTTPRLNDARPDRWSSWNADLFEQRRRQRSYNMKTNSGYHRQLIRRPVGGFISHHHPPKPVVAELFVRDRASADGCARAQREVPVCLGCVVLVEVERKTGHPLMNVEKGDPLPWDVDVSVPNCRLSEMHGR